MKKAVNLTLVGICLIISGIVIILSENIGANNAKIIVPILFVLSGVFSLKHAMSNKQGIDSKFQLIKGIGLLVFAALISFFADSSNSFLMYVTYFTLMYGLLEITFPFAVLNSKNRIAKQILAVRVVIGLVTAIGAVVLLFTTISSDSQGLIIAGALTILIGLSNLFFTNQLKTKSLKE